MGDCNEIMGNGWENAGGALREFGFDDVNDVDDQLIQFACLNYLIVTTMCFKAAEDKPQLDVGISQ